MSLRPSFGLLLLSWGAQAAQGLPPLAVSVELLRGTAAPPPSRPAAAASPTMTPSAAATTIPSAATSVVQPTTLLPAAPQAADRAVTPAMSPIPVRGGAPPSSDAARAAAQTAKVSSAGTATGATAPVETAGMEVDLAAIVGDDFPAPVRIDAESRLLHAERIEGVVDDWLEAQGEVELWRGEDKLFADRLLYRQVQDEVQASGDVRLQRGADLLRAPRMTLQLEAMTGTLDEPTYVLNRPPKSVSWHKPRPAVTAYGEAERIDIEGENRYRLQRATLSTCTPEQRDWYAQADEIELDYEEEEGVARGARIVFRDQTILWAPYLSFPLNDKRKSGFLAPTLGSSSKSGLELTVPWYWAIAPNMDATFAPRLLSRRGLQMNAEFRYLMPSYQGQWRGEYLPHDRQAGRTRSGYALQHQHHFGALFGGHLTGQLNVNGVSDDTYFSDLSTRVSAVTQGNLLRQGQLIYGTPWWQVTLNVQRYQTLQDPSRPTTPPYQRLPQLLLTANRYDLPAQLAGHLRAEYVRFTHIRDAEGRRFSFYPQFSLPWQTAALSVTPKLGAHYTRYDLDAHPARGAAADRQIDRRLPIFSFDAQAVFERPVHWFGQDWLQTLEPRLFYLYVPYREQSALPVFDSGLADFNFAQIFAENRYVGGDRIGDANQLTLAVVSRLIDPASGGELLRAALGQRLHFAAQRVTLPGEATRPGGIADVLAALSGRITPQLTADFALQYDPRQRQLERFNIAGRWQPEAGRLFNTAYRYTREALGNIDFSAQWPLGGGWHGVGRYNWSTKEKRAIELIGGIEYDGGCWLFRGVFQRLATQVGNATTAFYVQLELNGFSRLGSNPLELLRRNIPGYGIVNQPTADPVFAAQ